MMYQFFIPLLSALALASCTQGDGSDTSKRTEPTTETARAVESERKAEFPTWYVNGITPKNTGDKTGEIRVFGTTQGAPAGTKMYLYETEGKSQQVIDSAAIVNGAWDFGVKTYKRGFHMANFNGDLNNMQPVILNPDEKEVELNFSSTRLSANPSAPSNTENGGWFPYRVAEKRTQQEIRNLQGQLRETSFKERVQKQIDDKQQEYRDIQASYIERFPDTFLAKYLTWKNPPFPNDMGRYWDDIDFDDTSIIRTPIMPDRIQEFMRSFSSGEFQGFVNCVDLLKARAEENKTMLEFTLYSMLDGFYQSGMEDVCMYILDNYIFDDDCGAELSDVVKQRAEGIINLQIGKTPPNFKVETSEGKQIDFMNEVRKNDYTVLVFWASWCHKCEQEMPALKRLHDVYKTRGFNVVAFSVDANRQQWLKGIQDKQAAGFINVSQLMSWDSPISREYRITQTPTMFLLNREGKIVDKPTRVFEVERFLQQKL